MDAWTTIRYLHAQGKPVRAIAKELGIARNTVRTAIRTEQLPRYRRPPRPNPRLTPFADAIREMALDQDLIGTRIRRESRAHGYSGGMTALYRYLRQLKADARPPQAVERFETPPGQQGQFDWSPYTVAVGDVATPIIVFGFTLAFSRRKHYWVSLAETQASVFEAVEAAFAHFGGVPKEVLVDNAKVFVTDARPDRCAGNRHFLELCGHYAVEPVACHPDRPQTKGKVERPFFYLEQPFINGPTWPSFEALDQALAAFVADDLAVTMHPTTREQPVVRLLQERAHLTPLPRRPFVSSQDLTRAVSRDCLVSFAGSRYSVPWPSAGQRVWVRPAQGLRLTVRSGSGEVIARHRLAATRGLTIIDPAHYAGLRGQEPRTRAVVTPALLARFPDQEAFVAGVFAQHRPHGVAHLQAVLRLADVYPTEVMGVALTAAHAFQADSHAFVRGIVESGGRGLPRTTNLAPPAGDLGPPPPHLAADLGVYQALLEVR